MKTLQIFSRKFESVPAVASWYLSNLGEARGKQELFIQYILFIIKTAYKEFEQRLGRLQSPRGEKTGLILGAIDGTSGSFSISELQNKCPNVSVDMIRRVLKRLRTENRVKCLGRGQSARWSKTKQWQMGNTQ